MRILIIKEKNGDTLYNASTDDILYDNALYHLKNTTINYFDEDTPTKMKSAAETAIKEGNGRLAWSVLKSRRGYEYEEVELEEVLDFST